MKQLLIHQGHVAVEEVPAPVISAGNVLVEVAYSLISTGTEMSSVAGSGQSLLKRAIQQPQKVVQVVKTVRQAGLQRTVAKVQGQLSVGLPTGYSCAGTVLQVGEGISDLHPGDRVACAGAGLANHAEIVLVPRNLVVKVPESCSLRDAASMTVGAIAMQGVRRADPRLGEVQAVIGLGLLGQITVQLLKAAGCQVIGVDLDPRRVALARQLGAEAAFNPLEVDLKSEVLQRTSNYGVDAAIITAASASDSIAQQAMEITRKKGRVVVVGAVGLGLKRSPFYEKEIDFLISSSYGPGRYDEKYERKGMEYPYAYVRWTENRNMAEYLRLVAADKVQLGPILEKEYELAQAPQAYVDLARADEKPLGAVLRYPAVDAAGLEKKLSTRVELRPHRSSGKIGVAVVGAGSFARGMHLPNLLQLSDLYDVRAIVDTVGSNAVATAQQFGAGYASSDFQDVLKDPEVELVIITTRHHLHARLAIQAAQAGKAILVEKPMAMDTAELEQLTAVLNETEVPFLVGFNRRFSPAARRVKELIQDRKNPLVMLYRVNAGYTPPEGWTQTEEGGGRIIGEACHMFDLFQYWVGEAGVFSVTAGALRPATEHVLSSDNVSATVQYADGSLATLVYTGQGAPDLPKEYVEVYADGKVLVIDDYKSLRVYGSRQKGWSSASQDKGHLEELKVWAACLRGEREAPISLDDLVSTTRVSIQVARLVC